MNSSIINILLAVAVAVIAYFALPANSIDANLAIAVGILFGGIIIPFISSLLSSLPSEAFSAGNSTTTLYVGNLPYRVNEDAVSEHFAQHGHVESVRLMKDRRTGKRKGYGFVEVDSKSANKMIKNLNDVEFQERTLKVRLAKEKVDSE